MKLVTPTVDACARWAAPNASLTNMVAKAASWGNESVDVGTKEGINRTYKKSAQGEGMCEHDS